MSFTSKLIIGLLLSSLVSAQDIAILQSGDTIKGKIREINSDYLLIKSIKNPERAPIKLPLSSLKKYEKGYFDDTTFKIRYSDLIILTNGDSMQVKDITDEIDFYFFKSKRDNYEQIKKVPKSAVRTIVYKFYEEKLTYIKSGSSSLSTRPNSNNIYYRQPENTTIKYFRIGIDAGYYYRLAAIPTDLNPQLQEHVGKLKGGLGVNISATYFFSKYFGLGFDYLYFQASNTVQTYGTFALDNGSPINVNYTGRDEILINHFTPYVSLQVPLNSNKTIYYFLNSGVAYQTYSDKSKVTALGTSIDGKESGETIGLFLSNQLDFKLTKNIALGIRADYSTGIITKTEFKFGNISKSIEYERKDGIGLSRINISAGIRFFIY